MDLQSELCIGDAHYFRHLAIWLTDDHIPGRIEANPEEYYEAATTDGAEKLNRFCYITLRLLTLIVFFNMVLQMVGAFQAFTPAFIVSGGAGGPVDSTLLYTPYIYQEGLGDLHMGYGLDSVNSHCPIYPHCLSELALLSILSR